MIPIRGTGKVLENEMIPIMGTGGLAEMAFVPSPGDRVVVVERELIVRVVVLWVGGFGVSSGDKADVVVAAEIGQGTFDGGFGAFEAPGQGADGEVPDPHFLVRVVWDVIEAKVIDAHNGCGGVFFKELLEDSGGDAFGLFMLLAFFGFGGGGCAELALFGALFFLAFFGRGVESVYRFGVGEG